MDKCLLCGLSATTTVQDNSSRTIYNCLSCGVYVVSDVAVKAVKRQINEVCAFFQARRLSGQSDTVLISYDNAKLEKDYLQLTVNQILEHFPKNFTQQMYGALINLTNLSAYPGEEIRIEKLDWAPKFYLKTVNFDALSFIIKSMAKAELIEVSYYGASFFPCGVTVSPKGWNLAAEINEGENESVSPSVLLLYNSSSAKGAVSIVRAAAQKAVKDCGMKLVISDMIAGEEMICNEIASRIKSSAYILVDLSDARQEIFYAWGYARALGKPIFLTCMEEKKSKLSASLIAGVGIAFWQDAKQLPMQIYHFLKAHE